MFVLRILPPVLSSSGDDERIRIFVPGSQDSLTRNLEPGIVAGSYAGGLWAKRKSQIGKEGKKPPEASPGLEGFGRAAFPGVEPAFPPAPRAVWTPGNGETTIEAAAPWQGVRLIANPSRS